MAAAVSAAGIPFFEKKDPRVRLGFGIANVLIALFVAIGVFRFLPTRWWVVDVGAAIIIVLLGASGITLLAKHKLAERLTRLAAMIVLGLGLALFTALTLTATWISGVYGQVGTSGAIIFGLVSLLVLPYLVVFPAVQLAWVGAKTKAEPKAPEPKAQTKAAAEPEATTDDNDNDNDNDNDAEPEPAPESKKKKKKNRR